MAGKSVDEIYEHFKSLSKDELLSYAKEMCEAEGGEWCTVVDDLGGGSRSIWGTNNLGAVVVSAKRTAKESPKTTLLAIAALVALCMFLLWYFRFKK